MSVINIEKIYPYSKEVLWEALTNKFYISKWIMKTDFELVKGREFSLEDKPTIGWDGKVQCQLIDFEYNKILVYAWNNKNNKLGTIVKWKLEEVENGTLLSIEHSGFNGIGGMFTKKILTNGWNRMMSTKLEPVLREIAVKN